jgi:hypothetical protein
MNTAVQTTSTINTVNDQELTMNTATHTKTSRHFYATDHCCGGIYVRRFSSKASRDEWVSGDSGRYAISSRQAFSANTSAILSMSCKEA